MLRILLFLGTNIAVIAVASITLSLLGVPGYLQQNGTNLNLQSLLIFCAVFGFAGSLVSLLISKPMAKWSTRTQVINQPQNQAEQWLLETVQELSNKAGIKMPEVGIFQSNASNAFATGWNKNAALVAVSTGLLSRFDRDEVRAVLAHEIGHVSNGDMVTLALIQGVMNTFVMFFARIAAFAIDQFFRDSEGRGGLGMFGHMAVVFIFDMIFGILASIIVMRFSRWREFRADAAGAELGGRDPMIRALQRLKAEMEIPNELPETMTAFGIRNAKVASLFSSHPPLDDRIAALRNA
ncbi:protease HtpX [Ketobacter sp. MCCC 1A13808]|uniref:protease HtpX n=1 Tax=Ketobacter sp. MCCC 1A13808 TaxID=2602738 RepID=UPI0012EC3B88|nr:protease HtpX [Ketobacter sp. MCCC 1A13808]MVF12636.1 protease HtpX [Ketobacter sp. MCCC 1A13808]